VKEVADLELEYVKNLILQSLREILDFIRRMLASAIIVLEVFIQHLILA